jgi:hypothetical protein
VYENLIEGADYFVVEWCFPNCASAMFCVDNTDGTFTINLNARLTVEQLIANSPHEFRHIIKNHFQDERPIAELEEEASNF